MSLICASLIYGTENSFGQEKLAAVHLWSRVTRAMSNAFYTKNMFRPHYDELIAEWIGQRHHEISLIYSFGVVPNSAVFMRFQPFLMRKHRGKVLVQIMPQKSCLAPKIMGGCEASESFHQTVTKGLHSWTSLGEDAFKVVAEMINDLHIVSPGCATNFQPRMHETISGPIPDGMNVVEYMSHIDKTTNHFFYPLNAKTAPQNMPEKKRRLYCNIFQVPLDTVFYHCESCCEFFAPIPSAPFIDNSSQTLRQKVLNMCSHLAAVPDWIFPSMDEVLLLQDYESDNTFIGNVSVPVSELLQEKLHFILDGVSCHLCATSYVLFRAVWMNERVGHIFTYVQENRAKNFSQQADTVAEILKEMHKLGVPAEKFDISVFKKAFSELKKRLQQPEKSISPETPISNTRKPQQPPPAVAKLQPLLPKKRRARK